MSTKKLITAVLTGAAVGAIVGVLLAPDKGSQTRKKIAQKGNDLAGSVKEGFGKLNESLIDKYQNIKSGAKDILEKGKDKVAEAKENYKTENTF
jgi:gas vesicle protein